MAFAHVNGGNWQTAFTDLERLNDVTVEDIQRVAEKYIRKQTRTVGKIENVQSQEMSAN